MSNPTHSRSLTSDIKTVSKFIELIGAKSFKSDDIWIHQRRVKTISDYWSYPYAVHPHFDPSPTMSPVETSNDLAEVGHAWEGPRIKAVQLRDYLEELQDNS